MTVIAKHLIITGKVQRVYFRGWTVKTARMLGLAGWVRNRRDGSVEAIVQGESETVAHFLDLAQHGPSAARVEAIHVSEVPIAVLQGFEQRETV